MKDRTKILIGIMISAGLLSILGITYAFFVLPIISNNVSSTRFVTGYLNASMTDTELIIDNASPIYSEDVEEFAYKKEFKLKNNGTLNGCVSFSIDITEISTGLKNETFKWKLTNKVTKEEYLGSFNNAVEGTKLLLTNNESSYGGLEMEYQIQIWIEYSETIDQSNMLGGSLKGRIEAETSDCRKENNNLYMTILANGKETSNIPTGDYELSEYECQKGSTLVFENGDIIQEEENLPEVCKIEYKTNKTFAYTGSVQEYVVPETGYYKVELYGARGGDRTQYQQGYGGYTKGEIYLEKDEIIYVYVGQEGEFGDFGTGVIGYGNGALETWNGGGAGGRGGGDATYPATNYYGGSSGGGATDIRLVKASEIDNLVWNESSSFRSRIMVAGGGGGASTYFNGTGGTYNLASYTGNGGGIIGINGTTLNTIHYDPAIIYEQRSGRGGSQISGGSGYISGKFGMGGTGSITGAEICNGHNGGGGGYYGGGGGNHSKEQCYQIGGGGGSSYISGYAGVNSIQETGGTAVQPLHTNSTLHYSGKYFINGKMESGINAGSGKANISFINPITTPKTNTKLNNVRYIKSCMSGISEGGKHAIWSELQVIKNGINIAKGKTITADIVSHSAVHALYSNITDGDISSDTYGHGEVVGANCIYLDLGNVIDVDEIGIWGFYRQVSNSLNYTLDVSSNNTNWVNLHSYPSYAETSQGLHYTAWD